MYVCDVHHLYIHVCTYIEKYVWVYVSEYVYTREYVHIGRKTVINKTSLYTISQRT